MKIALIAHLEHPIKAPYSGGLEKHTKVLCDELTRKGHDVLLYADPRSEIKGEIADICQGHENFAYYHLDKENLEFYETYLSKHYTYMSFMNDILKDPTIDIVHNNSLHYLPVSYCAQLTIPMISVLHTPPLKELSLAYSMSRPDNHKIVSISNRLTEEWAPYVTPDYMVHNGTRVENAAPVSKGGGSLFWFGRITPEKGTKDAIEAAILANRPLELAGPISNERYFEKEIAPLLGPQISYLGHLKEEQIKEKLNQAALALITPKWEEPFGLVAIEALAQGTPIAAYDRGALREIVSEHTGELGPPDDTTALAACIQKALKKERQACQEEAFKRFSIERMVLEYETIYKLAIEKNYENRLLYSSRRFRSFAKGQINRSLLQ